MVLEVRLDMAVFVGEGHPELGTVEEPGVLLGALLGVADGPAGGHEAQFTGAYGLQAAQAVAVQDLSVVEPADGLEAHVRVRRDLHAGLVRDVVRPVVVDEGPRAHHATAQVGQQPAHLGGLAERYAAGVRSSRTGSATTKPRPPQTEGVAWRSRLLMALNLFPYGHGASAPTPEL